MSNYTLFAAEKTGNPSTASLLQKIQEQKQTIFDQAERIRQQQKLIADQQETIASQRATLLGYKEQGEWQEKLFSNPRLSPAWKLGLYSTAKQIKSCKPGSDGLVKVWQAGIAQATGQSPKTITRHMDKLAEAKVLAAKVERREKNRDGVEVTRTYIALDPLLLTAPDKIEPFSPRNHGGARTPRPKCPICSSEQLVRQARTYCKDCHHEYEFSETPLGQTSQNLDGVPGLAAEKILPPDNLTTNHVVNTGGVGEQAIPAVLKAYAQWVVWLYQLVNGAQKKPPYSAKTGQLADITDGVCCSTYEQARAALQSGKYQGLGFALRQDDPFVFADLDDCIDDQGNISQVAQEWVERLNTYTEISPSGRGLRIVLQGYLPDGNRRKAKIELYDREHYLTLTGQHLTSTPSRVEERQQELEALYAAYFTEPPPSPTLKQGNQVNQVNLSSPAGRSDSEVIDRARSARNGAKFSALFDGQTPAGKTDSERDLALCYMLAYWTDKDRIAIDRIFRQSGCMRDKWEEKRGAMTYGEGTIARALGERVSQARSVAEWPDEAFQASDKQPPPVCTTVVPPDLIQTLQMISVMYRMTDDSHPVAGPARRHLCVIQQPTRSLAEVKDAWDFCEKYREDAGMREMAKT